MQLTPLKRQRKRRGATAVEFALAAPILFLVVFATMEFWQINTFRNLPSEAAYEAARRSVIPGVTAQEVQGVALEVMSCVGASDTQVEVEPSVITNDTDKVTVTVSVPLDSNGWMITKFFPDNEIVRQSTMMRELAKL